MFWELKEEEELNWRNSKCPGWDCAIWKLENKRHYFQNQQCGLGHSQAADLWESLPCKVPLLAAFYTAKQWNKHVTAWRASTLEKSVLMAIIAHCSYIYLGVSSVVIQRPICGSEDTKCNHNKNPIKNKLMKLTWVLSKRKNHMTQPRQGSKPRG
jgi:hypothetical protein